MLMHRQYALLYETGIKRGEVVLVAMSDHCVRRWRHRLKDGERAMLVFEVAQQMGCVLEEAALVIDRVCSQYNRAKKERYAHLKSLSQDTLGNSDRRGVADSSMENETTRKQRDANT